MDWMKSEITVGLDRKKMYNKAEGYWGAVELFFIFQLI